MGINLNLSKQKKLILGIGIVLLFLALVYRFFPLVDGMGEGGDEISLKQQKMLKYTQRIQDGPALEKRRRALDRNLQQLKQGLLQARTPALAAVSMQNLMRDIASSMDVEVKTTRVLKPTEVEATNYIAVQVQFSVDVTIQQLRGLLYRIESSDIFLQVAVLKLNANTDNMPVRLRATITIEGMMRTAGQS